jgi:hypothetical protein
MFCTIASTPESVLSDDLPEILERFVVLLYDRTSNVHHVDEARKVLITQKGRDLDRIP